MDEIREQEDGTQKMEESQTEEQRPRRSSMRGKEKTKRKYFVCDTVRYCDDYRYKDGGLGRWEMDQSQEELLDSTEIQLRDENDKLYEAAKRLDVLARSLELMYITMKIVILILQEYINHENQSYH